MNLYLQFDFSLRWTHITGTAYAGNKRFPNTEFEKKKETPEERPMK